MRANVNKKHFKANNRRNPTAASSPCPRKAGDEVPYEGVHWMGRKRPSPHHDEKSPRGTSPVSLVTTPPRCPWNQAHATTSCSGSWSHKSMRPEPPLQVCVFLGRLLRHVNHVLKSESFSSVHLFYVHFILRASQEKKKEKKNLSKAEVNFTLNSLIKRKKIGNFENMSLPQGISYCL